MKEVRNQADEAVCQMHDEDDHQTDWRARFHQVYLYARTSSPLISQTTQRSQQQASSNID
jgi:hypothetical protein